jgi:hypothetical protein
MPNDLDVRQLVDYVRATVPEPWPEWPGGYPGQIEAALLDAVLSIRARYGKPTTGVRARVERWRDIRGGEVDDLAEFAAYDPNQLAALLPNRQRIAGRLKTAAVVEASQRLTDAGVRHAAQLKVDNGAHRDAYMGVRGLGPVTWAYFAMLLGHPGVKADTWVLRFVHDALGREVTPGDAERLVGTSALRMGRSRTLMDYAIWSYLRRPRSR